MNWPLVLIRQDPPEPPFPSRLETAIALWDVQAHRTLSAEPSLPNVMATTFAQRNLALLSTLVTTAAADSDLINRADFRARLLPALNNLQNAWGKLYVDLSELRGRDRLIHPELRQAETELKAAMRQISHDRTRLASPALIAERVDLTTTINSLQRGLAGGVNLGYTIRDAFENRPPKVAARPALDRAMSTAVPVPTAGWLNARDVLHNLEVTMPDPVREHLLGATTAVIRAAITADSASTSLSRHARTARPLLTQSLGQPDLRGDTPAPPARQPRPGRGR